MHTELLIARLARHAGPVHVLPPARTMFVRWALVSAVSMAAGVAWFGLRGDAGARIVSPDFLARALLAIALAATAARHAWSWSVPGTEPEGLGRITPHVLLVAWAAALVWPLVGASMVDRLMAVRWHPECAWQMATVALAPAAWMYWQVRRAAPYDLGWTSVQAALASAGVGALAVQWICGLDGAGHQLLWLVVPLLAITAATSLTGRRLLRRSLTQ